MKKNLSIKELLYDKLDNISEKKIQLDISKGQSPKIINEIISRCYPKILQHTGDINENVGIFAESLMHYLLTIALLPSQRKVSQNNIGIDIVIPDLKTLKSNPEDSIIIYFPKTNNEEIIKEGILKLEKIQPNLNNIWLVLHNNFETQNRTYVIENNNTTFSRILQDIIKFLSSRKQSNFKIINHNFY